MLVACRMVDLHTILGTSRDSTLHYQVIIISSISNIMIIVTITIINIVMIIVVITIPE